MTYDVRQLTHLLHKIDTERANAERLIIALTDAAECPGRLPGGRDPGVRDHSPADAIATDEARIGAGDALSAAYPMLVTAAVHIAGVAAHLDRALSAWEGHGDD